MGEYHAFSTNCQSFAQLFWSFTDNSQEATREKQTTFRDFPDAFNPRYFRHTVKKLIRLHIPEQNRQKLVQTIRNAEPSQKKVVDKSDVRRLLDKADEERRKMRRKKSMIKARSEEKSDSVKKKKEEAHLRDRWTRSGVCRGIQKLRNVTFKRRKKGIADVLHLSQLLSGFRGGAPRQCGVGVVTAPLR
jgi:hypothetical protein